VYSGANAFLTLPVADSTTVMSSAEADLESWSPRFQRLADAAFLVLAALFPVVGLTGRVVARAAPSLGLTYAVRARRHPGGASRQGASGGEHRLARGGRPRGLEDRVKDAKRQIDRLKRLVDELLDVSRIDTGRFRLDLASVDLGGVVRETVERFQRSGAQRIRIDIEVRSHEPIIGQWDRLRVEQVISNLLDNAVKFGGGKAIEVRVSADASEATLAVTDHGIGITPGDQQRTFERFERAVPARRYGGLGLGLYISRQIVEVLSGRISVTSQPQSGTTFTVTLPLRPSTAAASQAS
jgi:signal transduction histidine kinase